MNSALAARLAPVRKCLFSTPTTRRGLAARVRVLAIRMLVLAAIAALFPAPQATAQSTPDKSTPAKSDGYVGALACSRCHAEIYNHFTHTTMGRSLTPVTPDFIRTLPTSQPVYNQALDRWYQSFAKDGKLYQSEYQLQTTGPDAGKEVFRNTHSIEWIIGTNTNGLGGLITHDGYLFQAPLSYYPRTRLWNLSPGYQQGDYGFSRLIAPGCIFCHAGRSQPIPQSMGKYQSPPFTQTAIGCENCHGPGAAHVEAMGQGDSYEKGKDPTIVNPAHLATALSDDICMSCHQTGDARVFQSGKTYQDFRPGQPLDRIMAILMIPPTRQDPPSPDHAQHYYSMIMSKCYRASITKPQAQQMRCITCHDPHIEPAKEEAPAFFNGKCLSCHTEQSCKAPKAARQATTAADNCIGCHMPQHENPALSHSSITNHRIVTTIDEPYPDAVFEQTTAALPDVIYLNHSPGNTAPPPAITLLQAYDQLKDQKPEYAASWLRTLRALEKTAPENAIVQASLGHQDLQGGKLDQASEHLQRSLQLDPAQPAVYADLSDISDQKNQPEEAVSLARKAVALDPFNATPRKALVLRLINARQYEEAQAQMEKYLEDFPQDDFMRKMLAIAKQP
ncbi:hypothetical protein [Acidicapsa ligni]|uniref:hypothetical protein n=1 Tax=Acidicapsa ligni TaxID=542300 RepID=UPI0021E029DB|nr:hypothetical protein [Acidicapsa ligni]